MAKIFAQYNTETGDLTVMVDGSLVNNADYLCFAARKDEYSIPYAHINSFIKKDGIQVNQTMYFEYGSSEAKVSDAISTKADVAEYLSKK